jgi:hypothetical protein
LLGIDICWFSWIIFKTSSLLFPQLINNFVKEMHDIGILFVEQNWTSQEF